MNEHMDANDPFGYAFQENRQNYENNAQLTAYGTNWFPFHKTRGVVFPDDDLPLVFSNRLEAYERFIASAASDGFVVLVPPSRPEAANRPRVGTICKVVSSNNVRKIIRLKAVYRCEIKEYNQEGTEVLAKMLPEIEFPSFPPNILPKYTNFLSKSERIGMASRTMGVSFEAIAGVTQGNVEKCAIPLRAIVGPMIVEEAIAQGLTYFSYFAIRKLNLNLSIELEVLQENSAEARISAIAQHCDTIRAVCENCSELIFRQEEQLCVNDPTMNHVNEHGYVHRITLLSAISGTRRETPPSMEFTWFPGYSWIILVCTGCGLHIGWEYNSEEHQPNRFYGVRRESVIFRREGEEERPTESVRDILARYGFVSADSDDDDDNGSISMESVDSFDSNPPQRLWDEGEGNDGNV